MPIVDLFRGHRRTTATLLPTKINWFMAIIGGSWWGETGTQRMALPQLSDFLNLGTVLHSAMRHSDFRIKNLARLTDI